MTKVGDLRSGATGSAQGVISREALAEVEIPLAPLSAQQRIVKKLDALFSRTARARDDLDRIPALVSCYKQALLAAAFRGDLTADWRIENEVPPVDLANIERQRQEAWQMEPRSPSRYTPSEDIDWRPTIDLPASWRWASVGQLTFLVQYGSSAKTHAEKSNGIPVLRMGNIVDGKIDYSQMKYLPGSHDEFPVLLLQDGDLLFNRTNSAELVGKTAIYGGPNDAMSFASYLIRLKVVGFIPDLLAAYINSPIGRSWIASTVTQQVGQANVNGSKLKTLGVPVMPPPEQVELWHRISNAFTEIDRLTNEAASARRLLDRLDQAVLAKAFRGELVPQDPADEPASVLLERIRVERAAALEGNRRGRRGTREFGRRPGSLRVGRV